MAFLNAIQSFDKTKLDKTTTVVRKNVFVNLEAKDSHGLGNKEDFTEHFDTFKQLNAKIRKLAKYIKNAKTVVVYTGAGISTSANLDDYRGPDGMWTLASQGLTSVAALESKIEDAKPTLCHFTLVQLQKLGFVSHIVSTNTDGLHVRSGFPRDELAEMHGNAYLEICESCGKKYLRDYDTTTNVTRPEHWTGRTCEKSKCNGRLYDTIVGFGENLPADEYAKARNFAYKSDFSLVLGTSMKVQPSASMPLCAIKNGGKMVIVNLQSTDYDNKAAFVVNAYTDDVLSLLAKELNVKLDAKQKRAMSHYNDDVRSKYK